MESDLAQEQAQRLSIDDTRQQAHAYLDRLPADQLKAVRRLLESMLSPLDRALALAPVDDEPLAPHEAGEIEKGIASLKRYAGVTMEVVLADFGLTMDDLESPEKK